MNVTHFYVLFMWRCWLGVVFLLILFLKLYIRCIGKSLFLAMVHLVFHSCLAGSVMDVDNNV